MSADKTERNAIDLLKEQHREVEELFAEIEKTEDPEEKQALFDELADNIAVHATIEERHFYPAVRAKRTEEMVLEAFVEHTSIKRLLSDLLDADAAVPTFDAQLRVLKEQIEHHVEEEERELFPAARKVLDQDELVALAQDMRATQLDLEDQEPRTLIPHELSTNPVG